MEYLYHGSAVGGITKLRANSVLHGTQRRVLYLTDSIPYALFYIWDPRRTGFQYKHITAWLEAGQANYEEQFPGQLQAFYQGASGWLYRVEKTPEMEEVKGREGLFCASEETPTAAEPIPDVYEALLSYEAVGQVKIWHFAQRPPEKQEELTQRIAQCLAQNAFYQGREEAGFYRRFFPEAWERAERMGKAPS